MSKLKIAGEVRDPVRNYDPQLLVITGLGVLSIFGPLWEPPAINAATAARVGDTPKTTSTPVDVSTQRARHTANGVGAANAGSSGEVEATAQLLASRRLIIPVAGVKRINIRDTFAERRSAKAHEAIDIAAPRGTPVVAVDDGRIVKLYKSLAGGLTVYQFDFDGKFAYYYAHLDRYADGLREGTPLKRGDTIGYVGSTGNAASDAPHLHFAILRLAPDRKWWKGSAINPYPFLNDAP